MPLSGSLEARLPSASAVVESLSGVARDAINATTAAPGKLPQPPQPISGAEKIVDAFVPPFESPTSSNLPPVPQAADGEADIINAFTPKGSATAGLTQPVVLNALLEPAVPPPVDENA